MLSLVAKTTKKSPLDVAKNMSKPTPHLHVIQQHLTPKKGYKNQYVDHFTIFHTSCKNKPETKLIVSERTQRMT